jgi:TnpA family transposase
MGSTPYPRVLINDRAAFSAADLELIAGCRGPHNRLGFAYQLAFVRLTGRLPKQDAIEVLEDLLAFVAAELEADPRDLRDYARRQSTVSAHQQQIRAHLGLRPFGDAEREALRQFLFEEAFRLERISALVARGAEFLREQRILLPGPSTLRRLVGEQREHARQEVFSRVMAALSPEAEQYLNALVTVPEDGISPLQRLREPPGFPSPRALVRLTEKLDRIRKGGVLDLDLSWINNNLQKAMARRAGNSSAYRLRELKAPHRYAVLICFLRETYRDTLDQVVEMHGKLVTNIHRRAQNELDEQIILRRKAIQSTLVTFRTVGKVLLDESVGTDTLRSAVFAAVPREKLEQQVVEAEDWLTGGRSHAFPLVVKRFNYLRQFAPSLIEHLGLEANPGGSRSLLEAIEVLRKVNEERARRVPDDAPRDFVPSRIRSFLETDGRVDRRAYECAVLTAIRDEIRRGNAWVRGSRRFGRLDDFFLPSAEWERLRGEFFARAGFPVHGKDVGAYLTERLNAAYSRFLSSLPDNARLDFGEEGWHLSPDPAEKLSPEDELALTRLTEWLGQRVSSIRLPDLLIQVDNELYWTRHFIPSSRRDDRSVQDVCEVVAAVMAYGCNIGPETMAKLTNGVSYNAIRRIADWHLNEDTLRAALAELVNAISGLNTTQVWGEAKTSSSDGQRFLFPRKVLQRTYSVPIECTERDAAYALDGLLYHESDLDPEEHYTDTHGYTELNFAAFAMFGKRFCPRIRGLHRQWIYRIDTERDYGPLAAALGHKNRTIHLDWIAEHWDRMGQFFASFATGQTTASVALKRLVAFGPKNRFYRAVRELGRVFKTEFILNYLDQPDLRRRIRRGLLKGEQLHALARRTYYGRRGRADQRDFEQQTSAASCLLLILAAIIYWQIQEIERTLSTADQESERLDLSMLSHVSPIGWDNVLLYGEYLLNRDLIRGGGQRSTPEVGS